MTTRRQLSVPRNGLPTHAENSLAKTPLDVAHMPVEDAQELVQELQVHQIELEMQNDELRRTQFESESARERLRLPYDAAPVGFLTLEAEGVIREANLAAARLLNLDREKLAGQKLTHFIAPESQDEYHLHCRQLFSTGQKQACELRMLRIGGGEFIAQLVAVVEPAADGQPPGCLVILSDVTEQKRAAATLQAQEEQYRLLAETITDVFWIASPDLHKIHYVSPGYERIWGRTAESLYANPYQWLESAFPEDRERVAAVFAALTGKESAVSTEYRIVRPDGSLRWVQDRGFQVRDAAGNVIRLTGIAQEITERKRTEAALLSSKKRHQMILETAMDGFWRTDTTGRLLEVNEAYCRMSGYAAAKLLGMSVSDLDATERAADTAARIQTILQKGQLRFERQHRRKDGSFFDVEVAVQYLALEGGQIISFIRDITERKRTEEKLRESEQKFSRVFRSSPIALSLSTRQEGRYLDVNEEFLHLVQRSREEVIGRTALELGVWADPGLRAALVRQIVEQGSVRNVELQIAVPDGQMRQMLWSAEAIELGAEHCLLGSLLDITECRRAEKQLKVQISALTAAANAIVITNREGKIEWVNPAFTKLTGYSAEEAIGGNPRVLKSGQHSPAFYGTLWATVLTGNVWQGELVNKRKDGKEYTEEMTITPVREADGQITHFVAIKQDVTERRQIENRMQQAQKMEAIGTLAGGIAHDFNNMLGAMFGYAHLLQQDTEGNVLAQESVEEILKAANRAKELVQQILTFSRQRESSRHIIRLDPIIKEAMKFLRASLPANLKIETQLAPDAPAVLAEPTQVYQVTMNLATNALHAMEDQPGQLTVRLDAFQPDDQFLAAHPNIRPIPYARLTVGDTGHGMDAKTLERIFEPFFTTKPMGKGTGLGLSVVHGIMNSHEGVITVESQVGQGTTFRLYFPAQTRVEPVAAGAGPIRQARGRGQSILVLDDETALTSVLQKMLRRLDYQVATSNHPDEAIRLVRENPAQFDLVITDLMMPASNGLKVASQFRAIRPDLPVILVSGYSEEVSDDRLKEAGICERLEKPVSASVLAEVVQRVLFNKYHEPTY